VLQSNKLPILYRDKQCIDLASEIVWLALECKNIEYITVLVDSDDNVPRIIWPDEESTSITTDPIQLLEQIQTYYPDPLPFYPKISISVDASRSNILRLPGVMPRNSDPSLMSASPFLFLSDSLVSKSSHCVSIEELEEMMEEYEGPYICGKDMTAADLVWMPYIERYAVQLPLIFPNVEVLNPRSAAYELVREWCQSMENVAAYACRVRGDPRHWRNCLQNSVEIHNARSDDQVKLAPLPKRKRWWLKSNSKSDALWKQYSHVDGERVRPWLGDTAKHEAGLYLLRNRESILQKCTECADFKGTDEALRFIIAQLIDLDVNEDMACLSNAVEVLEFVIDVIEVPRDLGMVPAMALVELLTEIEA
jgi:hypothetical protein